MATFQVAEGAALHQINGERKPTHAPSQSHPAKHQQRGHHELLHRIQHFWVVRFRGDMCSRPIGSSRPARSQASAHLKVVVSGETTLWLHRMKEFHCHLNGEAPDDLDV
eukprot:TRINITY_DN1104_c0_g3_i2.p4 TRINITY_DN1104_c0_g3~~TRINITY_DN1104_c0_g3_i2.p4  ORF type:complete len:109 (-),score=14.97 TRINITY_DN1104_c0_g3_i2:1557-1883(-)